MLGESVSIAILLTKESVQINNFLMSVPSITRSSFQYAPFLAEIITKAYVLKESKD